MRDRRVQRRVGGRARGARHRRTEMGHLLGRLRESEHRREDASYIATGLADSKFGVRFRMRVAWPSAFGRRPTSRSSGSIVTSDRSSRRSHRSSSLTRSWRSSMRSGRWLAIAHVVSVAGSVFNIRPSRTAASRRPRRRSRRAQWPRERRRTRSRDRRKCGVLLARVVYVKTTPKTLS